MLTDLSFSSSCAKKSTCDRMAWNRNFNQVAISVTFYLHRLGNDFEHFIYRNVTLGQLLVHAINRVLEHAHQNLHEMNRSVVVNGNHSSR